MNSGLERGHRGGRRTVLEIVARGLLGVARQSFQLLLVQEPLVGVLAVNLQLAGQ